MFSLKSVQPVRCNTLKIGHIHTHARLTHVVQHPRTKDNDLLTFWTSATSWLVPTASSIMFSRRRYQIPGKK